MPETVMCPECGSANAPGADWCNLCFAKFDPVAAHESRLVGEHPTTPTEPASTPVHGHRDPDSPPTSISASDAGYDGYDGFAASGEQLSLIGDQRRTWQCRFCDTQVEVDLTNCPACQQSIYDSFGDPTADQPRVDAATALKWAAVPGGGHRKVGQGVLGVSIAAVVAVGFVFGLVMIRAGRASHGFGVLFIGLGTWLASVHDVLRIARQETDDVLLRPRVLSVLAGVLFMIVIAAAMSAQPALGQ